MSFLITGAQMGNKGAQSMLFITVDELKKRFPSHEVYFMTDENYDESDFRFKKLPCNYYTKRIEVSKGVKKGAFFAYTLVHDLAKTILGQTKDVGHYRELAKIAKEIEAIIDISGFAVGDKWEKWSHITYMDNILLAQKYNIPIYLMPQSFGPFKYTEEMIKIKDMLFQTLAYPRIIFAREKQGYKLLTEDVGLKQVKLSTDLVLQNRGIDINNIYRIPPQVSINKIFHNKNEKLVGIVPNQKCFVHGKSERNYKIYTVIIDRLLKNQCKIVLFRHSREDLEICEHLKCFYNGNDSVVLENKELDCFEYDEFVKQFDFIICSRFHGIVHSYRNGIPCILIGWATKYKELAQNVGQEEFFYDITDNDLSVDKVLNMISKMLKSYKDESKQIINNVQDIQRENCFDIVQKDLNKIGIS